MFPALATGYMFPALGTGYMFPRAWQWIRVLPRLELVTWFQRFTRVTRFSALGAGYMFPALGAGYTFSRAFYGLQDFASSSEWLTALFTFVGIVFFPG